MSEDQLCMLKDFQNLLFSTNYNQILIKEKFDEIKNFLQPTQIDHQLILAFSLDYGKIDTLIPFLSKPIIEEREFIHCDHELLFHLLQSNISFPISVITNSIKKNLILENYFYEELQKQGKLDEIKTYCDAKSIEITIQEKTKMEEKIEEIIEKDDVESFRLISNDTNFDFNGRIKKENKLFNYTEIPIILYCIEKKAIKCFKYALINGADPSQKSIYQKKKKIKKEKWDVYGFAGAIGNIQIIKLIEDQGIAINGNLIKGSSKFHQNHILHWREKENNSLLKEGMKEIIQYHNYEAFDLIDRLFNVNSIFSDKNKTTLHYAAQYNSKEIGEVLISKGADFNAKGIIYLNIIILFLIKII